jgi:murein L,D-transpeptidase YcbB/YkuD
MTDIGLLMTGIFHTRALNDLYLPEQQAFQLTNAYNLTTSELAELVAAAESTPPELIQTDTTDTIQLSILAEKREQIIEQIRQKHLTTSSLNLASSQEIPTSDRQGAQLLAAYRRYYRQPMPILRFGSSGVPVRILQQLLVSNGYGLKVDGVFGPVTETAVKAFQSQRELLIDGIVGQRTWWELTI